MSSRIKGHRLALRGRLAVPLVAALVALLVAGSGLGSHAKTPLETALAKALQKPTTIGLPKSAKPIPAGKSIVYIHCGVPACSILADGAKRAAQVLGWKY